MLAVDLVAMDAELAGVFRVHKEQVSQAHFGADGGLVGNGCSQDAEEIMLGWGKKICDPVDHIVYGLRGEANRPQHLSNEREFILIFHSHQVLPNFDLILKLTKFLQDWVDHRIHILEMGDISINDGILVRECYPSFPYIFSGRVQIGKNVYFHDPIDLYVVIHQQSQSQSLDCFSAFQVFMDHEGNLHMIFT